MNSNIITGTLLIVALALVVYVFIAVDFAPGVINGDGNGPTACTMEAKLCPDGSYVGRTGPDCAFAPCPGELGNDQQTPEPSAVTLSTRIDRGGSGNDVTIVPLEVIEDSRCPVDVECIWAGTVKVRARLESGLGTAEQVFTLGEPITTEAEEVTLTQVHPAPRSDQTRAAGDYEFIFTVAKR